MSTITTPATQAGTQLTIRQQLESESFRSQIAKVLPKHLKPERMIRVAVTALTRTPQLRDCDHASFFLAMLNLSQWGLEPDGRRAHLIPFRNNKRGCMEVQLIIDYKGLAELAMRSGEVSNIHADVVCENDEFEYDRGELKRHTINFKQPRGNVYAAYCLVRMRDGSEKCEVMNRDEIESVRKRSKAGNSGPWQTDWNEMAKKTVFRRVSKWLPLSAEVHEAVHGDDDVIDTTATPARPAIASLDELTDQLMNGDSGHDSDGHGQEFTPPPTQPAAYTSDALDRLALDLQNAKQPAEVEALRKLFVASDPDEDAVRHTLCDQRAAELKKGGGK